jgi:hypothetical protein
MCNANKYKMNYDNADNGSVETTTSRTGAEEEEKHW